MKIDFSTIVLIVLLVAPGLLARKSRNSIVPKSFEDQGPATELGELVTLGLSPHLVLFFAVLGVLLVCGLAIHRHFLYYLSSWDGTLSGTWLHTHPIEEVSLICFYVVASLIIGYLLGFLYGWLKLHHPVRGWLFSNGRCKKLLTKVGIFSILDESPISYEIFSRPLLAAGREQIVFLEIELRDSGGFFTGEVEQYAIVKDEEPHKPVIMRDVWFKATRQEQYERLSGNRVLLDLSEALIVSVSYQDKEAAMTS